MVQNEHEVIDRVWWVNEELGSKITAEISPQKEESNKMDRGAGGSVLKVSDLQVSAGGLVGRRLVFNRNQFTAEVFLSSGSCVCR